MPACWRHLKESQFQEVAYLIGLFYKESRADPSKRPWCKDNLKRFLLRLEFVDVKDIPKFRAVYLASRGGESICADPVEENSVILDDSAENEATSNLLDHHDVFALKPKKLVEEYKENGTSTTNQDKIFVHMKFFVAA